MFEELFGLPTSNLRSTEVGECGFFGYFGVWDQDKQTFSWECVGYPEYCR